VEPRRPNWAMLPAGLTYAASLLVALSTYLHPVWGYYGFGFEGPGPSELIIGVCLIVAVSLAMPFTLAGAANIVLVPLYITVFVPSVVFTLTVPTDGASKYGLALTCLAVVFLLACIIARGWTSEITGKFSRPAELMLLTVWAALGVYLIVTYRSIMSFADFTAVYEQRALAAATGVLDGYAQTYFGLVFSPSILAIGLSRRRLTWIGTGIAGSVVTYMIGANRTVILLPLVMTALFALLTIKWQVFRSSAVTILIFGVVVAVAAANHEGAIASHVATHLVFRTLSLPGLMFSQYYDLFSAEGFTWWAHVKGMNLVMPPPPLAEHVAWPGLGYIMGDLVYKNIENNHNANLFASDGVAAAGEFGVIVIGLAFSAWLWLLVQASKRWDPVLTTLLLVPFGVVLTNVQFTTGLLSFGGVFWLLLLWAAKPDAS
jgi:hypothetical protein